MIEELSSQKQRNMVKKTHKEDKTKSHFMREPARKEESQTPQHEMFQARALSTPKNVLEFFIINGTRAVRCAPQHQGLELAQEPHPVPEFHSLFARHLAPEVRDQGFILIQGSDPLLSDTLRPQWKLPQSDRPRKRVKTRNTQEKLLFSASEFHSTPFRKKRTPQPERHILAACP